MDLFFKNTIIFQHNNTTLEHSNHTYIIHTSVLTHSCFLVPFLFILVCLHTTNVLQGKAIAATPVLLHVFSSDGNKMLYGNKAVSFSRCLSNTHITVVDRCASPALAPFRMLSLCFVPTLACSKNLSTDALVQPGFLVVGLAV